MEKMKWDIVEIFEGRLWLKRCVCFNVIDLIINLRKNYVIDKILLYIGLIR